MSEEKNTEENSENQAGNRKKRRKNSTFTFEYGDFSYDLLSIKHLDQRMIKVKPIYEELALRAMEQHYAFYGQLNGVTKIEGYVTRNAVIHCSCGNADIRLDAYEDHGVIATNKEPVLTCNDCQVDINIYRFGLCDAEEKYGKLSALRPSGEKEMNEAGIMCYRCVPVLAEKWRQKEGDLLIGDVDSGEFAEALKAGAYLTCRYGGIIEVVEVPDIEVSEMDNEESEGILPLESKWLEEHIRDIDDIDDIKYVSMEFLNKLGWTEIADYFMDEKTGERSDWMRVCKDGVYRFEPDPKIVRHYRPLDEQDIINLNRVFMLYDITNRERICAFLSQTAYECVYGQQMCEVVGEDDTDNTRTAMEKYILENNFDKDGNFKYPYQYRGGGAIHTTHKGNYQKIFSEITNIWDEEIIEKIATEYTGDKENAFEAEKIISIGAEYVAYNYPWLSAGIFWKNNDLNTILEEEKEGRDTECKIGISKVIKIINPGSKNKSKRADAYTDCLDIYDKCMKENIQGTENE